MNCKAITLLLFMILFLPLYSAGFDLDDEVQDETGWASKASGNWHSSTPSSLQETSLKPINNLVPSPYGEFDPLVGYSPVPNLELENSNTLALVQLNSNDGGLISKLSEQFSFSILDRISTNVWIIKSSETNELSKLYEDSSVRWFSYLPTGGNCIQF